MRNVRMSGEGGAEAVDAVDGGVAASEVHAAAAGSKNVSTAAAAAERNGFLVLVVIAVTSVVDLVASALQRVRPAVSDRAGGNHLRWR
uniref:Uncharacterized protein n=1 Tax=Micromonospora robiginosa TaxID=2749844 RepID=A0A7L6B3U3_9ACTN